MVRSLKRLAYSIGKLSNTDLVVPGFLLFGRDRVSPKRAKELASRNDCSWHFGPRAWKRLQKELSEKREEKDKSPKRLRRPLDSEANR